MKFSQYLNEKDYDLNEIKFLLERDCKPFLKDWRKLNTDNFLYTGRKISEGFVKKKEIL
jgi:hypothetical protein